MTDSLTYADAGVDIDKANALVDKIKEIAGQTPRTGVIGEIGGFGGGFFRSILPVWKSRFLLAQQTVSAPNLKLLL